MATETHRVQEEPAEGSRETIEHELKRQSGKEADKARKPEQHKNDTPSRSKADSLPGTDPSLYDPDKTPGTGMLPEIGKKNSNMQPSG